MPLHWQISPLEHLVVRVSEGVVTIGDIETYPTHCWAAGALAYGKIFDATHGASGLTEAEMAGLRARLRSFLNSGPLGPIAVVAGSRRNWRRSTGRSGCSRPFTTPADGWPTGH